MLVDFIMDGRICQYFPRTISSPHRSVQICKFMPVHLGQALIDDGRFRPIGMCDLHRFDRDGAEQVA